MASLLQTAWFALPRGHQLPEGVWPRRHRAIVALLALHAAGLAGVAFGLGYGGWHALLEGGSVATAAVVAAIPALGRRVRASVAALGLMSASAVLVHLSGGYIEMHFHFFVMVGVLALYQDWMPFLLAVAYVVLHHGVVGVLLPSDVYNHPAALAAPWLWAGIHGGFLLAASVVSVVAWRVSETAHARLNMILRSAGEGICGLDGEGRITFINQAGAAMLGRPVRSLIGQGAHVALHVAEPSGPCRLCELMTNGVTCGSAEERFQRGDVDSFPVQCVVTPLSESGRRRGTVVVFNDVSERKEAERNNAELFAREREARAAAELSEQSRRMLFMNAPLPMWVFDMETLRFLEVNEAAVTHYGYSRDDFLKMRITDLRSGEDVPRLHDAVAKNESGVRLAGEWSHRCKDGRLIDVEIVSHNLDFSGGPARLVVVHDITERKRAQAALRESQAQVLQLQKMEAVGRLAGGVAHDFNNLLTVIQGRSAVLLRLVGSQENPRRQVEIIDKTARRAALLTAQLLAFSRKQILQPKMLQLNTLVADTQDMLRRLIGENIEMVFYPGDRLGHVMADPGQVEQVIVNLVVNARDAMPDGGRLTLETANVELDRAYARSHPAARPGPHVMLAVTDTGTGMDSAIQARIFEPFFTTKGPQKGTGLGLATVYGIVKQSKGNICVYSEPGHGTCFKVYLPRVQMSAQEQEAAETAAPPARGRETIILVEDEPEVGNLAREVLEDLGYTVLAARGPLEAVALVEGYAGPIHLLVSDVVMPDMNGRRLADRLLALRPTLKVLYMSGYTDNTVDRHGVLDTRISFLQKPFTSDALGRRVRAVLDNSDTRALQLAR